MLSAIAKQTALTLIRVYRLFISPWTLPSCRFQPTCSTYAVEAIERFVPGEGDS